MPQSTSHTGGPCWGTVDSILVHGAFYSKTSSDRNRCFLASQPAGFLSPRRIHLKHLVWSPPAWSLTAKYANGTSRTDVHHHDLGQHHLSARLHVGREGDVLIGEHAPDPRGGGAQGQCARQVQRGQEAVALVQPSVRAVRVADGQQQKLIALVQFHVLPATRRRTFLPPLRAVGDPTHASQVDARVLLHGVRSRCVFPS